MQTSIPLILVLGSVALAAACGGRIETVSDPEPSPPSVPPPAAFDDAEPEPAPAPPPAPASDPAPGSCATFDQVLAALHGLGCSARACHGGAEAPNQPLIDLAAPLETKRGFYAFVTSDGKRYVDFRSLDPSASSIACNLRGTCGIAMPLGGQAPESTIALIERWLACGAPP